MSSTRTKRRSCRRATVAVIAVALSVGGCSTAQSHWQGPFTDPHPYHGKSYIRGTVAVGGIYDIMVPDFHNYSDGNVRIESVRLVSPSRNIRVLGARAYPYSRVQGTAVIDEGDLAKGCPRYFVQRPITDVVVAPRSETNWYVVIVVKFLKPGMHYHFGVARVNFLTDGKHGWQYVWLPNAYLRTVSMRAYPHLYSPDLCG